MGLFGALGGAAFLESLRTGRGPLATEPLGHRYINDIWLSALNAWGVPTTIYGDPQYSGGVIPGLFGP